MLTLPTDENPLASFPENSPVYPVHLKVLAVSADRECLREGCRILSECQVEVDAAASTLSGGRLLSHKHYQVLVIDPEGIDWHHLQMCAAIHSIQAGRAMPVVAILRRAETELEHRWGEGNDFDEELSLPLVKSEVAGFLKGCCHYCRMSAS